MKMRAYYTVVETLDDLFLYEVLDGFNGLVSNGTTCLIERTRQPRDGGIHLIRLSGIEMMRELRVLPGWQVRIRDNGDKEGIVVGMNDPSFQIVGRYRGIVKDQHGKLKTNVFGEPDPIVIEARQLGLL